MYGKILDFYYSLECPAERFTTEIRPINLEDDKLVQSKYF